uniref:Uncharacterized protein n=1 Tax=Timema genevievae TaxID=629358 RepID=A0A7R9JSJ5_TIMGE|nr:unnamed protein product [Timema genevievae]
MLLSKHFDDIELGDVTILRHIIDDNLIGKNENFSGGVEVLCRFIYYSVDGRMVSKSTSNTRTLSRHQTKQAASVNSANIKRSTSMGVLNQSDSESDISLTQRPSASLRVTGIMRPTISSQNKITVNQNLVNKLNTSAVINRRRGISSAYSSDIDIVNLSQVGSNEDSSSEETSPGGGKPAHSIRPRSTSADRLMLGVSPNDNMIRNLIARFERTGSVSDLPGRGQKKKCSKSCYLWLGVPIEWRTAGTAEYLGVVNASSSLSTTVTQPQPPPRYSRDPMRFVTQRLAASKMDNVSTRYTLDPSTEGNSTNFLKRNQNTNTMMNCCFIVLSISCRRESMEVAPSTPGHRGPGQFLGRYLKSSNLLIPKGGMIRFRSDTQGGEN